MTIKAGVDFILKIDDGTGTLITVAAMTTTSLSLTNTFVDVSDLLQEVDTQATADAQRVRSASAGCSGFAKDGDSRDRLMELYYSGELFDCVLFFQPDAFTIDKVTASAKLTSLSFDGGHTGAQAFTCALTLYATDRPGLTYYAWNPLDKAGQVVLSNSNYTATLTSEGTYDPGAVRLSQGYSTGRYYWELTLGDSGALYAGVATTGLTLGDNVVPGIDPSSSPLSGGPAVSYSTNDILSGISAIEGADTQASVTDSVSSMTVLGVAVDFDHGIVEFYHLGGSAKSSPWLALGFLNSAGAYYPCVYPNAGSGTILNAGQDDFVGTVPDKYAPGLFSPIPTFESVNTEAAEGLTWTIVQRSNRHFMTVVYPDGRTVANCVAGGDASDQDLEFRCFTTKTSGKYYIELTKQTADQDFLAEIGLRGFFGARTLPSAAITSASTCLTVSAAIDITGGTIDYRDETNDEVIGAQVSISDSGFPLTLMLRAGHVGRLIKYKLNAGQDAFVGTVPSGYTAGWPR